MNESELQIMTHPIYRSVKNQPWAQTFVALNVARGGLVQVTIIAVHMKMNVHE